jgi:AcrR family transcriptional regulator
MSRDLTKEKIISESINLFMTYGLRSVTMDDIAKHLGMSKKTIYQHFKDKEEIIIQATNLVFDSENKMMCDIEDVAENAVEHLYKLTVKLRETINNTSTTALYDMKKYYPRAWEKYKNFKHNVIYTSVIDNLKRGMNEGLFRKDINPEILAQLRIGEIELSFNKEFFPEDRFSLVEIHDQLFEHFTYGILSEDGIKLFETYKQKNNINEAI